MKSEGILKHLAAAFILAAILYALAYFGIENRRTHKGPWEVTFTRDASGSPALFVNQPQLGITNVQITFPGIALSTPFEPVRQRFDQPRATPYDLPFGQCLFMDTTSLPGTVVFKLFGHDIQLLPRVLTIDRTEQPWRSGALIPLSTATNISGPGLHP